jgi:hypothetical protein
VTVQAIEKEAPVDELVPMTVDHRLTVAHYKAAQCAATRPSRSLEPLPSNIKGPPSSPCWRHWSLAATPPRATFRGTSSTS